MCTETILHFDQLLDSPREFLITISVVMGYQETVVVGGGGDADTEKVLKLVTLKLVKLLRKDLSSLTTAELHDIKRFEHVSSHKWRSKLKLNSLDFIQYFDGDVLFNYLNYQRERWNRFLVLFLVLLSSFCHSKDVAAMRQTTACLI